PTGGNVAQFGSQGGNNGQFLAPIGIAAVNQTGSGTNLFVADSQSNMIQQFAPEQPPTNTAVPQVTGNAVAGDTLTTDNGTWTNNPTSFSDQWQRCDSAGNNCSDIGGATNSVYTLTGDDVGGKVRVVVTAHNANPTATSAPSSPSDVVVGAPASPSPGPSISGTPKSGETLTADRGTWPNDAANSYAYQWERCDSGGGNCADIAGA